MIGLYDIKGFNSKRLNDGPFLKQTVKSLADLSFEPANIKNWDFIMGETKKNSDLRKPCCFSICCTRETKRKLAFVRYNENTPARDKNDDLQS